MIDNLGMEKWTKIILEKQGWPVKVYVNHDDSRCVIFPLFGRYSVCSSDKSALDLWIMLMFHVSSETGETYGVKNFGEYCRSSEDTAIIYQEAA